MLTDKDITQFLLDMGFSKREMEVYLFLAKSGVQSTSFVAKKLKMERVQAYRTFKKLQEKGFIEATLERPTRFTVVPFERLLDLYIELKMGEIKNLNNQKKHLISSWRTISKPESDYNISKFSVISGKKKVHSKMMNMMEQAEKVVYILTTGMGIIQEDMGGIFDALLNSAKKHHLQVKIIADISKDNFKVIERISKYFHHNTTFFEYRHLTLNSKFFPRFIIKDNSESILYAPNSQSPSVLPLDDEGLWVNDKRFISILNAFFAQMWQIALDGESRIEELKTGIPAHKTEVIRDASEVRQKIIHVLQMAKKDVILILPSQSINQLVGTDPFEKYHKPGLIYRLMTSIDSDNLEAAKKLSLRYNVKHVPIDYMTMLLVDNKNLFMFKTKQIIDNSEKYELLYLSETFFTNDPMSSQHVSDMLNDTWKRGVEISEITSQPGMKLPNVYVSLEDKISKVILEMLRNNVNSVLICNQNEPVGLINNRDILKVILNRSADLDKTIVKSLDFTPIVVIKDEESMTQALKLLKINTAKKVAVVKDGQLMAMVNHTFYTQK